MFSGGAESPKSEAGSRAPAGVAYVRYTEGGLPLALTSFVGREHDVGEVARLLEGNRLVTLCGPGGSGKTRLAMAAAREAAEEPLDGAWWVWLAPLSDPALVPRAVAEALGLPETPGRPPTEAILEFLGPKEGLLVLDNCEHLIDPCAGLVEQLLRFCPGLRILATSRELLGIAGETSRTVPPLSLPASSDEPRDRDGLLPYDATRLFVERAEAAASGFVPAGREASAVVRVCRRLEGIPLAIELAAARTRALSVGQISERLDDVFGLLVGGGRTAPDRQRTLRATMDWSHELLSGQERLVFRRLSVFAGGFALEAAEDICAGGSIEGIRVLETLSRLVDKSLVVVTERGGEARYRLLQIVRQYASEKLEAASEEEAVGRRHALFFLCLAEEAEPELNGAGQAVWLERLAGELDNIRAAMRWLRESGETEGYLRLAGALWRFCYLRGFYEEGYRWLEGALSGRDAAPASRAKALLGAGVLALLRCEYDRAKGHLEEALVLYRGLGDGEGVASALQALGSIARERADYARAEELHGESLALWRGLGDGVGEARSLNYLGFVAWLQEKHQRAREICERTLVIFRDLGDSEGVAWGLISLGASAQYAGSLDRARGLLDESLALSGEVGYREGVAWSLDQLGVLALREGDAGRARRLLRRSLGVHRDLGDRWRAASVLEGLAEAYATEGHPGQAALLLGAADAIREAIGAPVPPCERPDRDRASASVRARMGEEEFARTRAEGRAMTLEEAFSRASEPDAPREIAQDVLSAREAEVLGLVAEGLTDQEVAQKLHLSPRTVGRHLSSVYRKLGVRSRTAAARAAAERGLV
jgi:predicted ATPase/DNA-binding CsgD family transcriptional regulator